MVVNPTLSSVEVKRGESIARFETGVTTEDIDQGAPSDINAILEIDTEGNTITIGDNLNEEQIKDVNA